MMNGDDDWHVAVIPQNFHGRTRRGQLRTFVYYVSVGHQVFGMEPSF